VFLADRLPPSIRRGAKSTEQSTKQSTAKFTVERAPGGGDAVRRPSDAR
jgi:hypothetical protein